MLILICMVSYGCLLRPSFWWYVVAIVAVVKLIADTIHNSFKAGKWYLGSKHIGYVCWCGTAMTWVQAHRQHHAHSDTELDPHRHSVKGIWAVYVNTWGYGFKIKRRSHPNVYYKTKSQDGSLQNIII